VKISGRTQAVPGVQADVSLSLEDADTGELVAGPFSCPGQMFTDVAPEHRCGPFEATPARGHRYVVIQSWEYTGRRLLPGGTARGEPFEW
jgi:serine/threonine-protein kinase